MKNDLDSFDGFVLEGFGTRFWGLRIWRAQVSTIGAYMQVLREMIRA